MNVLSGSKSTGGDTTSNTIEHSKTNVMQQCARSVKPSPAIVFSGCNFSRCSVNLSSGQPSLKAISEEVLTGLSVDEIFKD